MEHPDSAERVTTGPNTDVVADFFARVAATPEPLLHDVGATIRIDLDEDETTRHWYLSIDHGRITVSRRNARADAVMHTDRALFHRVVTGEANALTAALRGRLRIDGDARLLVAFKRLLPGPPGRTTSLPATDRSVRMNGRPRRTGNSSGRTASAGGRQAHASAGRTARKDGAR